MASPTVTSSACSTTRGSLVAQARVSDEVAPGVVLVPVGHWPGQVDGGVSVNALTSTRFADIGRAPTFSDTAVQSND